MPDTNHPPYGVTQPRQLNRWLDVNAQNGPLKRTRKYVDVPEYVPAFGLADYLWLHLIAAYKYEAPNKFSILNTDSIPTIEYAVLCVAWKNADGTTERYILKDTPSAMQPLRPLTFPVYNGETIPKKFRIEFWSWETDSAVYGGNRILPHTKLETSVLGNLDYRNGVDESLATPSAVVDDFSASSGLGFPIRFSQQQILDTN